MQSNEDFECTKKSNTGRKNRSGRRESRGIEKFDDFEESENEVNDIKETRKENQRNGTVLRRFKNKIWRKSARNTDEEDKKMSSAAANCDVRCESAEENDYFEGNHLYDVPLNLSNSKGTALDMKTGNSRFSVGNLSEGRERWLAENARRNSVDSEKSQDVCVKYNGGVLPNNGDNSNDLAKLRQERFKQGKSMSLPGRPRTQAIKSTGNIHLPCDLSSEDSSPEDCSEPVPPTEWVKKTRSMKSQSLPSPSKLNLNYHFLNGLNNLCKCGWYWGPLTSKEAEVKLRGKPDGAFLVRDSNDNRYLLSLSFRSSQKTLHTRIEFCKGKFSFYAAPFIHNGSFASVVELIEHCMETSKNRIYCYTKGRAVNGATFPVRLTKPLSRFEYVCTLQHLCRFVIRQHISLENISEMPLPRMMKRYLEKNYFDPHQHNEV